MAKGKARTKLLNHSAGLVGGNAGGSSWGFIYQTSTVKHPDYNIGDRVALPDLRPVTRTKRVSLRLRAMFLTRRSLLITLSVMQMLQFRLRLMRHWRRTNSEAAMLSSSMVRPRVIFSFVVSSGMMRLRQTRPLTSILMVH